MYNISINWLTRNRKDQRSDGLTNERVVVYIQRDIKHSKRIMGSEGKLNNYNEEGYTRINQTIRSQGEDADWNRAQCLYGYTAPIRE